MGAFGEGLAVVLEDVGEVEDAGEVEDVGEVARVEGEE